MTLQRVMVKTNANTLPNSVKKKILKIREYLYPEYVWYVWDLSQGLITAFFGQAAVHLFRKIYSSFLEKVTKTN